MIKEIIVLAYNFLIKTVLHNWIGPYILVFFIHFFPLGVNLFSVLIVYLSKIGILYKYKIKRASNVIDEFHIEISEFNNFEEINIIMRGKSADLFSDKIDYSIPTFYVAFNNTIERNSNSAYITADYGNFVRMKKKGVPIVLIGHGEIKSDSSNIELDDSGIFKKIDNPSLTVDYANCQFFGHGTLFRMTGSGVLTIIGLSKIAKKINIYGWDFFLDDFLYKKSYIGLLLYMVQRIKSKKSILANMFYKIMNINYAARISTDNRFNVQSFLTKPVRFKNFFNKIEKIIYK
jgi:hypothetical protein